MSSVSRRVPSGKVGVGKSYWLSPFVELGSEERVIQVEKPKHLVKPRGGLENTPVAKSIHARDFSPGMGFVELLNCQQFTRERVMVGVVHVVKVNRGSGKTRTLSIEQAKAIPRARPVINVDGDEADHLTGGKIEPTQCRCDVTVNDRGVGGQSVLERVSVNRDKITPEIFLRMIPIVDRFGHPRACVEANDPAFNTVMARELFADAAEVKQPSTRRHAELNENKAFEAQLCSMSGSELKGHVQAKSVWLAGDEIVFDFADYVAESSDTERRKVVDQRLAKTLAVYAAPNSRLKKFAKHFDDVARKYSSNKPSRTINLRGPS